MAKPSPTGEDVGWGHSCYRTRGLVRGTCVSDSQQPRSWRLTGCGCPRRHPHSYADLEIKMKKNVYRTLWWGGERRIIVAELQQGNWKAVGLKDGWSGFLLQNKHQHSWSGPATRRRENQRPSEGCFLADIFKRKINTLNLYLQDKSDF